PRAGECRWLIDGEPTDNRLAAGSKGSLRLTLRTEGVTAHSAYPEQGRSAIDPLLDVLADVRRTPWPTDPFFGDTTLNIGVIAGGSRPNVVAGDARAAHERISFEELAAGADAYVRLVRALLCPQGAT